MYKDQKQEGNRRYQKDDNKGVAIQTSEQEQPRSDQVSVNF